MHPWDCQQKHFLKCSEAILVQSKKHRVTIKKLKQKNKQKNPVFVWIIFASLEYHIEIIIWGRLGGTVD